MGRQTNRGEEGQRVMNCNDGRRRRWAKMAAMGGDG